MVFCSSKFSIIRLPEMDYYRLIGIVFFLFINSLLKGVYCAVNPIRSNSNERKPISECTCVWSEWMNNPDYSSHVGDNNTYPNLRQHYNFCKQPSNIECRNKRNPETLFEFYRELGLNCDVTSGLLCVSRSYKDLHDNEKVYYCDDYEIRVLCCDCPEESTIAPLADSTVGLSNFNSGVLPGDTSSAIIQTNDPGVEVFGIPLSLIIVIVVAILLIIGISLCVVCTHKERKQSKVIRRNLGGDSYLQRPVSFTDVDLMKRGSLSSSSQELTDDAQHRDVHLTELDNAKLRFLVSEPDSEPDLVSSTKYSCQEPILHHNSGENRWLPDEYGRQLETQGAKSGKKSKFSRSVPSSPPLPPTQKSVMFPDNEN